MTNKYSVTVAIPTYNRANFLAYSIQSALAQSCLPDEVIIVDNGSEDNTREVVHSFKSGRLRYEKSEQNIGIIENWKKCVDLANGNYVIILGDDDVLYPGFIEESIAVHRKHENLGFTFSHCNKVDESGKFLMRWGYDFPPSNFLRGIEYLYWTAVYGCCLTNSSTVLFRRSRYYDAGEFKQTLTTNTFDFNMWIRLAISYDVFFIDKVLVDYRLHKNQFSEIHWRTPSMPTGKVGSYLEILGFFHHLLANPEYAGTHGEFLLGRIRSITEDLAAHLRRVMPEL
jgi:glycosyltransferase involved in cell wall biosynthesis